MSGIRKAGRIARVDLAAETALSQATVTTITGELLRAGLIEETKRDDAHPDMKRGRPRVDLRIRGEAHLVAGIKVSDLAVTAVLADFENTPLADHRAALPQGAFDAEGLADFLHRILEDLTAKAGRGLSDLSGVGLGLAGVVDGSRGFVYWSPSLRDRNVALAPVLDARLGLPVFVDNDANLVAVAEQYYGEGRGVADFLVVTVEHGVGMGIVLDNKVYRGARGCGAEFGHTKVQLEGALCRCGQRGCLEAYVADYAMMREMSVSTELQVNGTKAEKLSALAAAAQRGERTARMIVERARHTFVLGLANLVNIFDPELIVISGEQMQFDYLVASDVVERIAGATVQVDMPPPRIVVQKWDDHMWARGATAYAIDGVSDMALRALGDT
jgi:predicted NBD/HSP70 family sugar kinase